MAKKKQRQNSNSIVAGDPSESSDTACVKRDIAVCPHINKSVDANTLRKNFRGNGHLSNRDCSDCKRLNKITTEDIWLCLRCGNCSCGPDEKNHGFSHFETPRSDSHSLSLKLENLQVWCYDCKIEISVESSQKLHSCVDFVKQQRDKLLLSGQKTLSNDSGITADLANNKAENDFSKENVICKSNNKQQFKSQVKGLTNLGNTCFFNSVLQCLAQTPGLTDALKVMQTSNENFRLSLGNNEELNGELVRGGPVGESLLELLTDMGKSDSNNVLTPRKLLTHVRKRSPQFEGGDQQDAHELLRQLLDVVRTDDLRRYQRLILEKLGLSTKVNPANVPKDVRVKTKELCKKVYENVTIVPDQVFKGILVSQLQCQFCFHTSDCYEEFLDLSLPVITEKPIPPVARRKNQVASNNDENKDDVKKKRWQFKKNQQNRRRNGQHTEDGQESSDADVEDNDVLAEDRKIDVNESGYSSEKLASSRTSPTAESRDAEDSACASPSSVPCVSCIAGAIADLHLEVPNTTQVCEKNASRRPESGLGSSIVSVQESNVSVLEPFDVIHCVDSSDSLKCNPSGASDAPTLEGYIGNERLQDLYGRLAKGLCSEQDDCHNVVSKCEPSRDEGNDCIYSFASKDVPNLIDFETSNVIIDGNHNRFDEFVGGCADVDKELTNYNQNGSDASNWDCDEQMARSSPVEVVQGGSLDSNLLSMSLQSYKAEFLSGSPNQDDDFSNLLVAPTVPKEDSLIETIENVDESPQPIENNVQMGFVLVGGLANGTNCDLSVNISKQKTEVVRSNERKVVADDSSVSNERNRCNSATRNKDDDEQCLDLVNSEVYNQPYVTLAPQYQCAEGECSVLSCLNHFTGIEIMAGSNLVGCKECTRQNKGPNDKEPKTVYRMSTKRLLIHSPPSVLILHLKRFQVQRYSVKKLSCHVMFPDILDIAPFCSYSVQKTLPPGQTQVLYSLYGVVAHSGTLHGGHYFAYVKVRSGESEKDNPRQGTWYTISDSHTKEVAASTVFNSQAYLLFYERFL